MTQQWQAWAQGAQERLLKRVEAVEHPRWVDIRKYGLRRSSKLLSSDLFEKVTNAGLPKGEHKLSPEDEVWATQGRANATKVDSIPLNIPGEPIVLLRFKERLWVLDGHHRVARARKEGVELPAVVYDADLQVAKAHVPEPDPDMEEHVRGHMNRVFGANLGDRTTKQVRVNADNLTERDGIHHRTGGRWHHKSGLIKRISKHLQGKHDQKKHGLRGNRKTTHKDPAQLDAPEFLTKGLSKWLGSKGTFWDGNYKGITVDSEFQSRLTDAYDKMPSYDKDAEGAYSAFRDETSEQFDFLTGELGIRFEVAEDDPYRNVIDATRDVEQNRRLKVYPTAATGGHPFLSDDENDRFRFVHDIMGHVATGRDFDRHGEEAAYLSHATMYSDEARKALASETRGQNAYLIKRGDFPEQKVALLPDWAWSTGVSKHLMGMHDQDKHAEKQPGSETSDKGKKGKIQSTLNRLGFERDDNLSLSEKTAFAVGGAALALVIGKRWRNVSDTINSKPVPGVEFPTAAPKPRVKNLDDFVDGDILDTDVIKGFEGGTRDATLGNIEKSIKSLDREFGFVVGHEGKVHAGFAGNFGAVDVSIPEDLPRSARRKLTVTHNHPSGSTLSAPDVNFAIKEQLGSIRAVTPDGNTSELAFTKNFSANEMHYMQAMTEVSENTWFRRAADEVGRIPQNSGKEEAIRNILTDWDNPLHSSLWSEYAEKFDGVVFARHTGIAKHMLGRHNQKTHGRRHHDMMRFTRDVLGQEVKWDSDTYYNPSGDTMMSLLGGPNPDNFKYKTSSKHPGMALLWNTDTGDSILLSRDKEGRSKMRSIGLPERLIRRGFLAHGNYVAAKETGNRIAQQIGEILPPEVKQRIYDEATARMRGPVARHARRTDVRKSITRVIEKHEGPGQHSTGTDQSVHGKGKKGGGQLKGEFDPKDSLWTPGKETGEHGIMLAHVGDPVHRYFPDTDIDDSKGLAQTIANATEALRWWNKTDDQGQKYPSDPEDRLARERSYLIDPDGKVVGSMIGIRGAVAIGPDDDPHDGHVFLHNHPSNTSLSLPDIAGAFHNRLGEAHVIADRGGFWAKFKKGGRQGSHDFNTITGKLTRADGRVKRAVQRMVSDGEVSLYNANKMHPHVVQMALQRRGMDSYYDYGTDGNPIFDIDLLDPGDEVTKAHDDVTLAKGFVPMLDGMPVIVDEYPGAVAEAAAGNPEPLLDVVRVLYRGADIDISRWRDVYHEPVEKRIQQFVSKHLPGQHDQKSHGRRRPATQSKFLRGRIGRSGGYTYQPLVPSSPKKGYAVSVLPEDEVMTFGVPTRSNIATFIMRNRDKLEADESLHAGAWYDRKTGRGYLDMSIVTDSKAEAQALAKEHDQIAFIDLKTFDEFDQEGRIR